MSQKFDPDYQPRLVHSNWDITKRWYIDFRVWDTDKNTFVRKQYTGMNKHKTLYKRKAAATEALKEISELIKNSAVTGNAPVEPDLKFDIKKLTIQDALTYYVNYKNAVLTNGSTEIVHDYNEGKVRISKDTFQAYRSMAYYLMEYLKREKRDKVLLKDFTVALCQQYFTFLHE